MDKQKQIEEMARVLHDGNAHRYADWVEYTNADLTLALKLYNAGYRKIPEGAVVLETSVYESLEIKNYRDVITERVRKETAEKFAERVKEETDHGISALYDSTVDEICKEITEGKDGT